MIREATPYDRDILADIIRTSFRDVAHRFSLTEENCPKHPSNCTPSWIENDISRGVRYFILERDNTPVGCVGVERSTDDVIYMERLSVLPGMRGKRYGVALVRHALDYAAGNKAAKVNIGIIAEHTELKQWYQSLGFCETQTKRFPHLPFTVCFMECDTGK